MSEEKNTPALLPLDAATQKAAELKAEVKLLRARLKKGHDYLVNTLTHNINQGDTLAAFGFERE